MANVKKKSAHNIVYGMDKKTGEMRHISEVPRGAACGCICSVCGLPLEARKGDERQHHFAHDSNNDCCYGNEIAVYKEIKSILENKKILAVPTPLESACPETKILIEDIDFSCKPSQYPPVLKVLVKNQWVRILVEFKNYYTEEDLKNLCSEAQEENYFILGLSFPDVNENSFFTQENLIEYLTNNASKSIWRKDETRDNIKEQSRKRPHKRKPKEERNFKYWRLPALDSKRIELKEPEVKKPTQEELDQEEEHIKAIFNPDAEEKTRDRFGRRWIQCEKCGKIQLECDIVKYGGKEGPNRGICRQCARN